MKKKIIIIFSTLMLFMGVATADSLHGDFNGDSIVRVTSEGKELTVQDVPAVNRSGRTLIPVYLLKQLGAQVTWNADTYTADVTLPKTKDLSDLYKQFGSAIVSSASITMDGTGKEILTVTTPLDLSKAENDATGNSILFAVKDFNVSVFDLKHATGEFALNISDLIDYEANKININELFKKAIVNTSTKTDKSVLTTSDIAKLTNRVGIIYAFDRYNNPISQGSGFMLYSNGLMITNHHVINGAAYETIKVNGQTFTTHFVGFDNATIDLCGIAFNLDEQGKYKSDIIFPHLNLNTNLPQVGDKVFAIGSPRGLENTVSEGIVSGIRKINGITMIQHTANTDHGSSGGVLLNEYGEVIGVTSAMIDGTALDFAIAASYVKDELDKAQK